MESIREGWLIKSPPEKRTQGRWKLFRAKWRRRYFVLYAPPAVDIIPGMCAAILDYYGGKNLRHKHGTIDLTHCEEVLAQLDATFYQNVFGLRTQHKNRDRTYYLVAETEADMNDWVNSLCFVLGMKENVQDPLPSPPPGTLSHSPRTSLPSPSATSLFNSVPSLPPPRSETLPFPNRVGRRVLSHTRVQSLPGINEAMNSEMEEWQNNQQSNNRPKPLPPTTPVNTRDNHLTLRFVPPPPPTNSFQRHSCILSAIPDLPQVFKDPLLSESTSCSSETATDYDTPRQSYYHQAPSSDDSSNGFSGTVQSLPDGFYNVPNKSTFGQAEQECLYKIPPPRSRNFVHSDNARYDVPASVWQSYDVPAKCIEQHSANGEHYDVPLSGAPAPSVPSRLRGENCQNGEKSVESTESSHLLSVLQNLINELPTLSGAGAEDRIVKTPVYCNWDAKQTGSLESKISSQELLSLSPPVPGANDVPQHSYINEAAPNIEALPCANSCSRRLQNARPPDLPRHPAYSPVPTANDPICFTNRSRSFKRVQGSFQKEPLCLPLKRISDLDESSSISDDEEACSSSNPDCSNDPSSPSKPSIYDVVPLPSSKDLGCNPAVSRVSEVIKYLDLDLESGSVPEKTSSCTGKSFEPAENVRDGVHYKEIDWCKTKALTETRREVENNRRTGERTLGD